MKVELETSPYREVMKRAEAKDDVLLSQQWQCQI